MKFLLAILIIGLIVWFVSTYNNLRRLSETVRGARSNVLVATRKRVDLAKRIASVASSYADHEKLNFALTNESVQNFQQGISADTEARNLVGRVDAIAMQFPNLKANSTYEQLMSQWHELENDLHSSREAYNARTTAYNSYRGALPQILFADKIGYAIGPYYETELAPEDGLAELVTDDGQIFRDGVSKIGEKTKSIASQARNKIAPNDASSNDT